MPNRNLILLVLFIISAFPLAAQVGYGPEAGIGMSSMQFVPAQGFTSASGSSIFSWKAGGLLDFGLNKHFYLQSGIYISQKGQNREFALVTNDTSVSFKQTLTIYYAEVPVNVIYKTGSQGKGRFFVGLGVSPSYILTGSNQIQKDVVIQGTPFITTQNTPITYRNPIAQFDIGMNFCTGYELPTGLFFRVYYTSGVRDIGLGTETDKNRIWGVSAGYIFGKGRNINKEADDLIDKSGDQ